MRAHRHASAATTTVAALAPARPHRKRNPPTTTSSTTVPPAPSTPLQIDTQGHEMMLQGDYTGAIAAMRQVLAATAPGSLLHAYALFDLGRSLRLAGDPQAAIPILEQRLQYPNQTGVVRVELKLAERAAGVPPAGGGKGHGHGHEQDNGHGHGPDGGAAIGGPGNGQGGGGD